MPAEYEALITLVLIGLTFYIGRMMYDAVRKKNKEPEIPVVHIEGDYNNAVNIITDKLVLSSGEVERAI